MTRRRGPRLAVCSLTLAVTLLACSGDGTGGTSVAPSTGGPATTGSGGPARPDRWFGVQDGELVAADGPTGSPVVEPGALDEFGERPVLVRAGAASLFVSFCCEPAEGRSAAVDLDGGRVFESWDGVISSVTGDDRWARVLTNGMQVLVEAPSADPLTTTTRDFLLPAHTALSPDGMTMAVVAAGPGEDLLYGLAPGTPFLEDGTELARGAQNRVTPALPVIDARGRVWYLQDRRRADQRVTEVVVDPASGEVIERFEHPKSVVDQDFDASGRWLLVVYEDGTLGWRSIDGRRGELPGSGWTTADW